MRILDAIDARILLAQEAPRDRSLLEIAAALHLSRNTVQARLKRLRDEGVLAAPSQRISTTALGRPLLAFITLSVAQPHIDAVYAAITAIPEVVEAHTVTGEADLMVRVVATDTTDLHRVTQAIQLAPGVLRSNTSIATTEVIPHRVTGLLRQLARDAGH